jgi:hypothetical protein
MHSKFWLENLKERNHSEDRGRWETIMMNLK